MNIRPFTYDDVPALLILMKHLAVFEGYIDDFTVTERDLIELGLCDDPIFKSLVAEQDGTLLGYLTYYQIDFTYDLKPKIVLKELYVDNQVRGQSIGAHLFRSLIDVAENENAGKLEWLVLPTNERAKRFYASHGGQKDLNWENWILSI